MDEEVHQRESTLHESGASSLSAEGNHTAQTQGSAPVSETAQQTSAINDEIRQGVARQIEDLLLTEADLATIHNKLFAQGGLFHRLAPTKEERHQQRQSALYQRARTHVNRLMAAAEAEIRESFQCQKMTKAKS